MDTDPVCLVYVDESLAEAQNLVTEQHGRVFHFCSDECKQQFDRDPTNYVGQPGDWDSTDIEGTGDYIA